MSTRGHLAVDNDLGQAAGKEDAEAVHDVLNRVEETLFRQLHGEAEGSLATGNDGDLEDLVGVGEEPADQGVTSLVVGNALNGR